MRTWLRRWGLVAALLGALAVWWWAGGAPVAPPMTEQASLNQAGQFPYTLHLALRGADGALKAERWAHNLITTAGKNKAVARLIDGTATPAIFNFVGIGEGSPAGTCAAAAAGDTALQGEVGTRQQDTDATPDPPTTTGQQELVVTFAAGNGTGSICEVMLFNASAGGDGLLRNVFGVITKGAGDSLQVTVRLTVS